jgi:hypothetical protein
METNLAKGKNPASHPYATHSPTPPRHKAIRPEYFTENEKEEQPNETQLQSPFTFKSDSVAIPNPAHRGHLVGRNKTTR